MNKKILMVFAAVLIFAVCFCIMLAGGEALQSVTTDYEAAATFAPAEDLSDKVGSLFVAAKRKKIDEKVYVGGYPVGLSFEGEGAFIIGLSEVVTKEGVRAPALTAGLQIGDKIIELDGVMVPNTTKLMEVLAESEGRELSLKYIRGTTFFETTILPALDLATNTYKLGLWSKDSSSGVGTMTFVRQNGAFASLGHPVIDSKTGRIVNVTGGTVYGCEIVGVDKGTRGTAGALKGNILTDERLGKIFENNKYGVYGMMNIETERGGQLTQIASADEVRPGNATILSTVNGQTREYKIEIVKASRQSAMDDRGMVIKVNDKELIDVTGGIVQGMSGSPILQNGKLVGAVTHVFVNDPTRGYGVYAEWMFENTDKIIQKNS